jgi:hypothetical protein
MKGKAVLCILSKGKADLAASWPAFLWRSNLILLMSRYNWSLYKTLEFLNSRRPDLEIRASFFYQLNTLETKLENKNRTASWNEVSDK